MSVHFLPYHDGKLLESKLLLVLQSVYVQRIHNSGGDKTLPNQGDRKHRKFKEGLDHPVLLYHASIFCSYYNGRHLILQGPTHRMQGRVLRGNFLRDNLHV